MEAQRSNINNFKSGNKNNRKAFSGRQNFQQIDNGDIPVPKLRWNSNFVNNNLMEWKRSISKYAMFHFKELSFLFDNDEYFELTEIPIPTDDEGHFITNHNDPGGYIRENYKIQLKLFYEKKQKMESNL